MAAFTELVGPYQQRLLRFLSTRCACMADAEDALQDTLLNAWRYLHSYDARWRFSTWLYRIAIRNAARQYRPPLVEYTDSADHDSDPMLHCMSTSVADNLWLLARRELREDVFTALWLRYAEDMSVNDVAAALQRSTSWTKVNLMRARNVLEKKMDASSPEN